MRSFAKQLNNFLNLVKIAAAHDTDRLTECIYQENDL